MKRMTDPVSIHQFYPAKYTYVHTIKTLFTFIYMYIFYFFTVHLFSKSYHI